MPGAAELLEDEELLDAVLEAAGLEDEALEGVLDADAPDDEEAGVDDEGDEVSGALDDGVGAAVVDPAGATTVIEDGTEVPSAEVGAEDDGAAEDEFAVVGAAPPPGFSVAALVQPTAASATAATPNSVVAVRRIDRPAVARCALMVVPVIVFVDKPRRCSVADAFFLRSRRHRADSVAPDTSGRDQPGTNRVAGATSRRSRI